MTTSAHGSEKGGAHPELPSLAALSKLSALHKDLSGGNNIQDGSSAGGSGQGPNRGGKPSGSSSGTKDKDGPEAHKAPV